MVCVTNVLRGFAPCLPVLAVVGSAFGGGPAVAGGISSEAAPVGGAPSRLKAPVVAPRPAPPVHAERLRFDRPSNPASSAGPVFVAPVTVPAPRGPAAAPVSTVQVPAGQGASSLAAAPFEAGARVPGRKLGAPYLVNGVWYIPADEPDYVETGRASWYGRDFHGRPTANGEIFDMMVPTAAHPTLPLPSLVEVTNLDNQRSLVVRVNDRGPFVPGRLLDLSARGAELLGFREQGSANVKVRFVGMASSDPLVTAATLSPVPGVRPWARPRTQTAALSPDQTSSDRIRRAAPETKSAPTPPRPRQVATSEAAGPGLFVQIGAFSQRANAERAAEKARPVGRARIVEASSPAGPATFRVIMGPVRDRESAESAAQGLADVGLDGARIITPAR